MLEAWESLGGMVRSQHCWEEWCYGPEDGHSDCPIVDKEPLALQSPGSLFKNTDAWVPPLSYCMSTAQESAFNKPPGESNDQ